MSGMLHESNLNMQKRERFSEKVSTYYLELERLLDRVENAANHYQALGIDRSATTEDIQVAYRKSVTVLYPSQYGINISLPEAVEEKTKKALEKVSQAFNALGNYGRRVEYDNSLRKKNAAPIPVRDPDSFKRQEPPRPAQTGELPALSPPQAATSAPVGIEADKPLSDNPAQTQKSSPTPDAQKTTPSPAQQELNLLNLLATHNEAYVEAVGVDTSKDHRKCPRFKLKIPVRVSGYDKDGKKWKDMGQTIDVSRFGVAFSMRARTRRGMVLHLNLPLPTRLRAHGYSDPSYSVWAIVRRVEPPRSGVREVGVEFLGEHPPPGFLAKPGSLYRNRNWDGVERRREDRKVVAEQVTLEFLDENQKTLAKEKGVIENVSRTGARVRLKSVPDEFDTVRVTGRSGSFTSLAAVRDWFAGKDGYERLCLNFLEEKWPV
jgi:curved DNA-binding protein CbpA